MTKTLALVAAGFAAGYVAYCLIMGVWVISIGHTGIVTEGGYIITTTLSFK